MARVAFRKGATEGQSTVEIVVDGRPLIELVRDAESEDAAREGHPDLVGKYGGLPWEVVATRLLLGESAETWTAVEMDQHANRVPLLVCDCGEPGCWPLVATIEVTDDRVTWLDFRQPHRKGWDYRKLGPFSFERAQYLAALDDARAGEQDVVRSPNG